MDYTLENCQKFVDDWIHNIGIRYFSELTNTAILMEEVGELAKEIRKEPRNTERLREEFADVFAWLSTLASLLNVSLEDAAEIYAEGCPKCDATPCKC